MGRRVLSVQAVHSAGRRVLAKMLVPVKSARQQGLMALHTVHEGFKEERTACINRFRGVLVEPGLVFPVGTKALRAKLPDAIEDASKELSANTPPHSRQPTPQA